MFCSKNNAWDNVIELREQIDTVTWIHQHHRYRISVGLGLGHTGITKKRLFEIYVVNYYGNVRFAYFFRIYEDNIFS